MTMCVDWQRLSRHIPTMIVSPLFAARPVLNGDVFDQDMIYLRRSHALVETTYRPEKEDGFNGVGTGDGRHFAVQQLAAAATELRDLIYTAWLRSADPVPQRH